MKYKGLTENTRVYRLVVTYRKSQRTPTCSFLRIGENGLARVLEKAKGLGENMKPENELMPHEISPYIFKHRMNYALFLNYLSERVGCSIGGLGFH